MISIIKGMYGILTDTYNIQFIEAEKKWQLFHGKHFQTHFNENVCVVIKISLNFNFVPSGPIDNSPTLVQVIAWHLKGDKPLTNQWWPSLLTHVCVTRPQWVKDVWIDSHKWLSITIILCCHLYALDTCLLILVYICVIFMYICFGALVRAKEMQWRNELQYTLPILVTWSLVRGTSFC